MPPAKKVHISSLYSMFEIIRFNIQLRINILRNYGFFKQNVKHTRLIITTTQIALSIPNVYCLCFI